MSTRLYSMGLLVYGFTRIYCLPKDMPPELKQLCYQIYLRLYAIDEWNNKIRCKGLIFDGKNNIVKVDNSAQHQWLTAFGCKIVTKGQMMKWKLTQAYFETTLDNDTVIGIIDADQLSKTIFGYFAAKNGGYGVFSYSGRKNSNGLFEHYASSWARTEVIEMTLDMKGQYGILSYTINGKDYGLAFDKIDINKGYCLAVSVFWNEETYQIIE
eukprot:307529_1